MRKLGELLKANPPKQKGAIRRGTKLVLREKGPTLADLGVDKKVSSLAQQIADLPMEKVEAVAKRGRKRAPADNFDLIYALRDFSRQTRRTGYESATPGR